MDISMKILMESDACDKYFDEIYGPKKKVSRNKHFNQPITITNGLILID